MTSSASFAVAPRSSPSRTCSGGGVSACGHEWARRRAIARARIAGVLCRLRGRVRRLGRAWYQIHAEQAGNAIVALPGQPRVHGLIPDADAVLVGTHLRAPQPRRAREDHGVRRCALRDFKVLAPERAAGGVVCAREAHDFVHLGVGTVAVFPKDRAAARVAHDHKRVAAARRRLCAAGARGHDRQRRQQHPLRGYSPPFLRPDGRD